MAMGHTMDRISSIVVLQRRRRLSIVCNAATATAAIDCNGTGATAIAMALGHRSRGNRTVIAMGQWGVGSDVYVLCRGSMSWIVVDKNVQNVWTAMIHEVVPRNKTCMIWSVLGDGPNEIYSGQ
jgi:hypothetical protein